MFTVTDDGRTSLTEAEAAKAARAAVEDLEAAEADLEAAIDEAKLGASGGALAAYRSELHGLLVRISAFADNMDGGEGDA